MVRPLRRCVDEQLQVPSRPVVPGPCIAKLTRQGFRILAMADLGKLLIFLGGILLVAGLALVLLGRTNLPIGRLPGDILYRGKHTTFYFPLATCIVLSVVLSLLLYFIGKIKR